LGIRVLMEYQVVFNQDRALRENHASAFRKYCLRVPSKTLGIRGLMEYQAVFNQDRALRENHASAIRNRRRLTLSPPEFSVPIRKQAVFNLGAMLSRRPGHGLYVGQPAGGG
ncbi:MAG: hypothetical protein JW818_00925, partial [Pirellulales bacterium]|nr:hypothetical protein [Pirellulales bacterium]